MKKTCYIFMFASAAFLFFITACGRTAPSRFYILNSISDSQTQVQNLKTGKDFGIGVGPVDIPDYLERPQLVTRTRENKIRLADFDKWAGSLKYDIPRVLSENLSILLNTDQIFIYPWKGSLPVKYQVKIDILRFDAEPEKNVVLSARWIILGEDGRKMMKMGKSNIVKPIDTNDYEVIVSVESQALADLSSDIAQAVKEVYEKPLK